MNTNYLILSPYRRTYFAVQNLHGFAAEDWALWHSKDKVHINTFIMSQNIFILFWGDDFSQSERSLKIECEHFLHKG